jgi:hypothetical protein
MDFVQPGIKWSGPRHNLIGRVADQLLTQTVRDRVRNLLGGAGTLESVSDWADRLKSNPPTDAETQAFLANPANQTHGSWHFVNLPFATTHYDPATLAEFVPSNGAFVIGKILESANALIAPTPQLSRVNALRWLAHLVGDMHQPNHLGCAYIDESQDPPRLVGDPQAAHGLKHDRGGNLLLMSGGTLHGFWDDKLGSATVADVEAEATGAVDVSNVNTAVTSWVDETLRVANDAYTGVRIVAREGEKFRITVDHDYESRNEAHVPRQMGRAAARLAALVTALVP